MRSAIALFISVCLSALSYGQTEITARVVDRDSSKPVPFASVGVVGTARGISTNLNGEFSLSIPIGATLKITCVGYESLTIEGDVPAVIYLYPSTTQLNEVYVLAKAPNPRTIVRRAFANISTNYTREGFLQEFFYRHYCKDDSIYGRLIEAAVEVWKQQGYKNSRTTAGDNEGIRVTQLRRSLDKTVMAQGHEAISVSNILQADLVGYQPLNKNEHLKLYENTNSLREDLNRFDFNVDGIATYDGDDAYRISYQSQPDSILTTSGYIPAASVSGTLYINSKNFAFLRTEEVRQEGDNEIRTSAFYHKTGDHYFPYHFIREGHSRFADGHEHSFHIELMSVDIRQQESDRFEGAEPTKQALLKIQYDSSFWSTHTILKTTPLENEIIADLGGGRSLNEQFYRYQKYEWATTDGGKDGLEKFTWLRSDAKDELPLYVGVIDSNCSSYLNVLERFKRISKQYRGQVGFVLLMVESDEARWQQLQSKYILFADGIINYRVDTNSPLLKEWNASSFPVFYAVSKSGNVTLAKSPDNEALTADLQLLIK